MRLTEMLNKLKVEETNKNRNVTYVRNDSVNEKPPKTPENSVPEGKTMK